MSIKTKWLLQQTGIVRAAVDSDWMVLQDCQIPWIGFGIIPFTSCFTNLEHCLPQTFDPNLRFIIRGGTKILKLLNTVKSIHELNGDLNESQIENADHWFEVLKAGIFYDPVKFDQSYYSSLTLPLLNNDSRFVKVSEYMDTPMQEDVWVKPSSDGKAFNAGIIEAGKTLGEFINSQTHQIGYLTETLLISSIKKIKAEYRFVVLDGKPIGWSQYRRNDRLVLNVSISDKIKTAANEFAKLYQPSDVFVMDLCELPNGEVKIIEYNCWNASGMYHIDLPTVYPLIDQYVKSKS